jgi:hypothetical protein
MSTHTQNATTHNAELAETYLSMLNDDDPDPPPTNTRHRRTGARCTTTGTASSSLGRLSKPWYQLGSIR